MIPSHEEAKMASHEEVKAAAQRYALDHKYKDLKIVLDTDLALRTRLLEALDRWDADKAFEGHKANKRSEEIRKELA